MKWLRNISKQTLLVGAAGALLGAIIVIGLRFALLEDKSPHYHANFAIYVNGGRDEFTSPLLYEEVQSCSEAHSDKPESRGHLHNQENSVIHVHDNAVTWGHFLANVNYGVTDGVLQVGLKRFIGGQDGNKLSFWLNGQPVDSVINRVIKDKDVLLINYGTESDEALRQRFASVPADADKYNKTQDPATCAGAHTLSASERLKRAFDLSR